MTEPRTLGVVGTVVWDRISGPTAVGGAVEAWGGISYALAALSVALPEGWVARPLVKVGADLAEEAAAWLARVPGVDASALHIVPEPNNRVEIRYDALGARVERLSGGVPPWSWPELEPEVTGCDALYVNFISGYEMELDTARTLSQRYGGPTWADLHSLFLGRGSDGLRIPRPLERSEDWLRCWDAVQLNEDELALLGAGVPDPWSRVDAALRGERPRLVAVTMGARGAAYATVGGFRPDPGTWKSGAGARKSGAGARDAPVRGVVREGVVLRAGDPTGGGDVWGSACFARLLAGDGLEASMREANRLAGLATELRGASELPEHLRSRGAAVEASTAAVRDA